MSKQKIIYEIDDFPIKKNEGGLYSILPYERLDKNKKALFKVGLAENFDKRFYTEKYFCNSDLAVR
jgi:hypothetical protein